MELETINKLYLELSQITTARTAREVAMMERIAVLEAVISTADKVFSETAIEPLPSDPGAVRVLVSEAIRYREMGKRFLVEGGTARFSSGGAFNVAWAYGLAAKFIREHTQPS